MREPLTFLLEFSPFSLAFNLLRFRDYSTLNLRSITSDELDNEIEFQVLFFKKSYNSLCEQDRELVKAKLKLNGKVNEAHLRFGSIIQEDDSNLYSLYRNDALKVSFHKYYVAQLTSLIYSFFVEFDSRVSDTADLEKSLESLKERIIKIENKAIPELPMDFVFENMKFLILPIPKLGDKYLLLDEFEHFIKLGFNLQQLPKLTVRLPNRKIGKFMKNFHLFFEQAVKYYSIVGKLEPFYGIVERSFNNFTRAQIINNMKNRS